MTQSFDEWFNGIEHEDWSKLDLVEYAHKSGAQSRQAEIDELKATIVKYEAGLRKNKANKHKLLAKNIELQKRVDEALTRLDNTYPENWGYEVTCAIEILKGEEND